MEIIMDHMSISPPNILVVDDVNANLAVLAEMIRKAGYVARPVTSARQAVSAIEALLPNLILLDISMPDIDGFVFCSMLKKNANTRDIPVIFITALNSTEDKIKGFQLGAVDYISKPFEVEEVTMRINTHLKMYKMQQELEVYNKKLYKIINDQIRKIYEGQKNVAEALAKLCIGGSSKKEAHMERIGSNSRILAISLQLSPKFKEQITNSFIDVIEKAAMLHDIGRLLIDNGILQKAKQGEQEEEVFRSHAVKGAQTLAEILKLNPNNEFIRMAAEIAYYHHERWDGEGYPTGKAGKDIPICARIVSIVDAYDTLMHTEIPDATCTQEEILDKINQGAGTLYDPDMVIVFRKVQNQLKR
jgi:putative two-component system response regulator